MERNTEPDKENGCTEYITNIISLFCSYNYFAKYGYFLQIYRHDDLFSVIVPFPSMISQLPLYLGLL